MKNLKMKILASQLNIKANNNKILIDNRYYPLNINLPYIKDDKTKLKKIFKVIIKLINQTLKNL